jgi:propanediol dehydratase small subunit
MNPIKFGQLMKHLVRAKQKKPDLPEVFRASDAPIPEETLTRDMFKEAQERFKNAKAGGGMLVQPGFGGTRQGYRSEKTQAVKRGGDKELLLRLVKKANEGFKYVKRKDLQVQAGYKRSTNITAKQIGLDTLETKFKKAFDFVMGNPDKFVTDMFDPMTQVKKLVGTNEAVGRYLKDYAPYEESRRLIKVLAAPRSKSFLQKAEGLTLGDLEFRIDNNIKGDNLFAPPKQVTAETKIMEIVDRHIKQGGKKIKWTVKPEITKGGYPSFGESRFVYNGKEYGMGELINEARDDPNFKEFFKAQRDYKTLNDKIVTNPKTGEKIRFGNLMKEVYGSSVVPYNIDHVKSIVDEPFTSLRILPARINKAAGNIIQMDEKFITNPELKGKYTKQGKEAQLKKIGYNFNQPVEDLIQAELKLADDVLNKGRVLRKPNEIVESVRKGENYVPDFYSKTAKPGEGFGKQLIEGQRLKPPSGSGAVTLGALDVPSMFKRLSPATRKLVGGFGGFIAPEVLFYQLDKRNRMSKGQSEKEAAAGALESATLGAYDNEAYMQGLQKTAESMGIDSSTFNSVYQLNILNKDFEKFYTKGTEQIKNLKELGLNDQAKNAQMNLDRYVDEQNKKYMMLQKDISDRITGGSPLTMVQGRGKVTQEQFEKPFFDIQKVALEKLKREKQSVFPTIQRKVDPAEGSMGTGFYNILDQIGQGIKNIATGRVVPFGPERLRPQPSQRQLLADELRNLSARDLQRFNLSRGLTYGQPLTADDIENLQFEQPGVFFSKGGIAGLSGGDKSGPPPERGPNPQGLPGLLKRVKKG